MHIQKSLEDYEGIVVEEADAELGDGGMLGDGEEDQQVGGSEYCGCFFCWDGMRGNREMSWKPQLAFSPPFLKVGYVMV